MNALRYLHEMVIPTALALLPARMTTPEAEAQLMATALQESQARFRVQYQGPANGFWQFEISGVAGVMQHRATRSLVVDILDQLQYERDSIVVQNALRDNDILAAVFARLLLWTDAAPLPVSGEAEKAWGYYTRLWRPGQPHRELWNSNYEQAWSLVKGE